MAIAGTVLTLALTGCIVFTLARGDDTEPYVELMAVGGASYAIALLWLRWRSWPGRRGRGQRPPFLCDVEGTLRCKPDW